MTEATKACEPGREHSFVRGHHMEYLCVWCGCAEPNAAPEAEEDECGCEPGTFCNDHNPPAQPEQGSEERDPGCIPECQPGGLHAIACKNAEWNKQGSEEAIDIEKAFDSATAWVELNAAKLGNIKLDGLTNLAEAFLALRAENEGLKISTKRRRDEIIDRQDERNNLEAELAALRLELQAAKQENERQRGGMIERYEVNSMCRDGHHLVLYDAHENKYSELCPMCDLEAQLRAAQEAGAAERAKNVELSHEIALAAENWAEREEEFNVLDNKLDAEREALRKAASGLYKAVEKLTEFAFLDEAAELREPYLEIEDLLSRRSKEESR